MAGQLEFSGDDFHHLFDLLIEASRKNWEVRPSIIIDGRKRDLKHAAEIISDKLGYDGNLSQDRAQAISKLFIKRQHGYGRTAYNLATRAHQNFSEGKRRAYYNSRMSKTA